ncbi:hypothetical protein QDY65_06820 [Pyrococcus kukulkanii]|uniref:hypothetical protein n=1 Tax=Pyrococcus kukulkanii TaxID=1609559 RepID=UPI003569CBB5
MRRLLGFFVLGFLTITGFQIIFQISDGKIHLEGYLKEPFVVIMLLLFIAFSWWDYFIFEILSTRLTGLMLAFIFGTIEGLFNAIPFLTVFWIFTTLLLFGKEKEAYYLTLLGIPVAFFNSYMHPDAAAFIWGVFGLMIGYTENAIIEEMAEGDIDLATFYFFTLGPLGFIPYSLQEALGHLLYAKRENEKIYYPVAPALYTAFILPFYLVMIHYKELPVWMTGIIGSPNFWGRAMLLAFAAIFFGIVFSPEGMLKFVHYLTLILIGEGLAYKHLNNVLSENRLIIALITVFVILTFIELIFLSGKLHYHGYSTVNPYILRWVSLGLAIWGLAQLFPYFQGIASPDVLKDAGILEALLLTLYLILLKRDYGGLSAYDVVNGALGTALLSLTLAYFYPSLRTLI